MTGGALVCEACREGARAFNARAVCDRRFRQSRIPQRYHGIRLERWEAQAIGEPGEAFRQRVRGLERTLGVGRHNGHAVSAFRAWLVQAPPRPWLWLRGAPGRGKTLLLSAVGQELLEAGVDVLYLTERSLFGQVMAERHQSGSEGGTLRRALESEVLLLDDANPETHQAEAPQAWMVRVMMSVLDERYSRERPVIFGSSGDLLSYAASWRVGVSGQGVAGRLLEVCSGEQLELGGGDWRGGQGWGLDE